MAPSATATPVRITGTIDQPLAPRLALSEHTDSVTSLAYSPDGSWLATGSSDHTIRLWEVATGDPVAVLVGHTGAVRSVAFTPEGDQLASGSEDGTIRIWSVPDGAMLDEIEGLLERVYQVSYSSDGTLLAAAGNRCAVEIRHAQYGILVRTLTRPGCSDRSGWATSWGLAFAPGGHELAAGEGRPCCGGRVHLWTLNFQVSAQQLRHSGAVVNDLAFSSDGGLLAVATNAAAIRLLEIETGVVFAEFEGHIYAVNSVSFSPDDALLVSGSRDQTIKIWSVEDGHLLQTLEGHGASVEAVAFSPDGSTLASSSEDGTVILWGIEGEG